MGLYQCTLYLISPLPSLVVFFFDPRLWSASFAEASSKIEILYVNPMRAWFPEDRIR